MENTKDIYAPENCVGYEKLGFICAGQCQGCFVPKVIDEIYRNAHAKNKNTEEEIDVD